MKFNKYVALSLVAVCAMPLFGRCHGRNHCCNRPCNRPVQVAAQATKTAVSHAAQASQVSTSGSCQNGTCSRR